MTTVGAATITSSASSVPSTTVGVVTFSTFRSPVTKSRPKTGTAVANVRARKISALQPARMPLGPTKIQTRTSGMLSDLGPR